MTSHITIDEGRVVVTPASDGMVWMTKHEIARLFGCFVAKVVSNIATILKSRVIDESRVCRFHRYKNGSGVELYSLEMIMALAFRIDTRNAYIFRQWLMERAMQPAPKLRQPISVLVPLSGKTLPKGRLRCREHRGIRVSEYRDNRHRGIR
jgi:hypothetical protein